MEWHPVTRSSKFGAGMNSVFDRLDIGLVEPFKHVVEAVVLDVHDAVELRPGDNGDRNIKGKSAEPPTGASD